MTMQTLNKGKLLRADDMAAMIGVSPRQAAKLMEQMPRVNIGSSMQRARWAVYEADVQAWLENRTVPPESAAPKRGRRRGSAMNGLCDLLDESGHIPRRK